MTSRRFYSLCAVGCLGSWLWVVKSLALPGLCAWRGCLFKTLLHVPCPSCGTTRSVISLLRGDLAGALALNPLGVPAAAGLFLLPLWLLADLLTSRATLHRFALRVNASLKRRRVFAVLACLLAANWLWLIVHIQN